MFKALKIGQAQRVIPTIGTLIPLFLFLHALLLGLISFNQTWAVFILILGLIFLTVPDFRGKVNKKELIFVFTSSLLFAVSYLYLRQAYLQADFLTVIVWSRVVIIPFVATILIVPALRLQVLNLGSKRSNFFSKSGFLFLIGQVSGGVSGFLLAYSISLTTPALVNSLQGTQYIFLFALTIFLSKSFPSVFKEDLSKFKISSKIIGIILIALGLYLLAFDEVREKNVNFGVTFSPRYASELMLDPKKIYLEMLDDLKVKTVRLPVYWDEVETVPGKFNFSRIDYYLNEAQKRNVEIILSLGLKQPRWPECFYPIWAKDLTPSLKAQKILRLIKEEVKHFKKYSNITYWQVENEPLLNFGLCDPPPNQVTLEMLKREIEVVKALDSRPVMLTDTGELSTWVDILNLADSVGVSLYRTVWNPTFGLVDYPLPPAFYSAKVALSQMFFGSKPIIISELQAEPWLLKPILDTDVSKLEKLFPLSKLKEHVQFAKETGIEEIYLWGIEWYYYMGKHGHPQYLDYIKSLFDR